MQKPNRKMRLLSMLLAVLVLCMTVFPTTAAAEEESATASTMQLMKTEGTVSVTNGTERSLTVRNNMRLYNGYHAETEAKSYAWINLDDEKLSKLDEASAVDVLKSGKKLEMLLKSGNLYFNVTSPLQADETLNIRTSTMAVGVRGTSGWVKVLDRWTSEIYILEGTVQVSVEDPVSGQVKTAEVHGGQKAIAVAYPQEQVGDKCDIIMDRFGTGDIDGFVLVELAQDPGLCGKIYDETGMDVLGHIGHLDSIRRQLENIRDELGSLREQIRQGTVSADEAQPQLDEIHRQLDDLRQQLEELGPNAAARKRLDDAQEHLSQAQEALDNSRTGDALDRLDDAREDLEDARGEMASDAQMTSTPTARERLAQDQQELQDKLDRIEDELAEQDHNVSDDPVWGDTPTPSPSPAPTGGGSSGNRGRTETYTMPLTDAEVQAYLDAIGTNGKVILEPSEDPDDNTLHITDTDRDVNDVTEITVDRSKTLTLSDGIDVKIDPGCGLTVNGTVNGAGDLTNAGTVTVGSPNTLTMRTIFNEGVLTNNASGHIVVTAGLTSSVSMTNYGKIDGYVILERGSFTMGGGEIAYSGEIPTMPTVWSASGVELVFDDGTITNNGTSFAFHYEGDPDNIIFNGTVFRAAKESFVAGYTDGPLVPDNYDPPVYEGSYYWLRPTSGGDDGPGGGTDNPGGDAPELPAGPFIVTGDPAGYKYSEDNYVLSILTDTALTIRNADEYPRYVPVPNRIEIAATNTRGANLTLAGVRIDVSDTSGAAAFLIPDDYAGDVKITLADGSVNELKSGGYCAGLQKNGAAEVTPGALTITGNGEMTAQGGADAAGIGGGESGSSANITIGGGTVNVEGGRRSAGIGGGYQGSGTGITVNGGTVIATGGGGGAGIGGGAFGRGSEITITGGEVTAKGTTADGPSTESSGGAGIGGGIYRGGSDIKITGGTVNAYGSTGSFYGGAGIGGGNEGSGMNIEISGGTVNAYGGYGRLYSGPGIGRGGNGAMTASRNITISGSANVTAAGGGSEAGIGAASGNSSDITVSGGTLSGSIAVTSGTFTMSGGEVISSGEYTVICGSNVTLELTGGRITNSSETGYALSAAQSKSAGITGTSFRAKTDGNFIYSGWEPADYENKGKVGDYFVLAPAGSTGGGESQYPFIVTLTEGGTVVLPGDDPGYYDYDKYTNPTVMTIKTDTPLTVRNAANWANTCRIELADMGANPAIDYDITLEGVNISNGSAAAFMIPDDYGGNVTITLADGSDNVFKSGSRCAGLQKSSDPTIDPSEIGVLTIQGGRAGTGKLTATGGSNSGGGAGIGGGSNSSGVNITISGGNVTVSSGGSGAGIGGGSGGSGVNITISGGNVTATGGSNSGGGAGIGGGGGNSVAGSGEHIEITGGEVEATGSSHAAGIGGGGIWTATGGGPVSYGSGSDITIGGGIVTATGGSGGGAGIGGGYLGNGTGIEINGGEVTATGGANAAGIGGGLSYNGNSGTNGWGVDITINGGTVTATGGERAAGIGGGSYRDGRDITITGGTVTATAGHSTYGGAGIGGGYNGSGTDIEISGGTVTATGRTNAAGIGGGSGGGGNNITISGGRVTAICGERSGTSSGGAEGIGGGYGGGGNNTIDGNALVYIESKRNMSGLTVTRGIVIYSIDGTLTSNTAGSVDLSEIAEPTITPVSTRLTIPAETTLTIPANVTLIIPEGATLTVSAGATLVNNGTIELAGIIVVETGATFDDSTGVNITGEGKVQRN